MNKKNIIKTFALAAAAYIGVAVWAMPFQGMRAYRPYPVMQVSDTVEADTFIPRYLPGEIRDTAAHSREYAARQGMEQLPLIKMLARSYGDSIVLRWSAPDYVGWRYLNRIGVDILRTDHRTGQTDTLATRLRPTPLELCLKLYSETDSVAMMGIGSIYNQERPDLVNTRGQTGEVGSLYDLYEDQMMLLGYALLASEWRPDVANHMAMRFVDRNVKKDAVYDYIVTPSEIDTTMHVILNPAIINNMKNIGYYPEQFDAGITDSVTAPNNVYLIWPEGIYSSYEIERREAGSQKWQRINQKPYITMIDAIDNDVCAYVDNVPHPGTYEYRILAHDSFGELTENTSTHTVKVGDLMPPSAPQITWINIIRPNEDDPTAEIWAEIHFRKDTMEADYIGCRPLYYHERDTEGEWRPLTEKMSAPSDTVCRVDVTNVSTGRVLIAAYDTAHNVGYSMPQLLRVSDMRPPKAPTGLKATTNADDGTITLTWDRLDDDVNYYEVIYANDTTHTFMATKNASVRDTCFVDSVDMTVNQKYIYYMVRAVDYASNIGPFSDTIQVIRPSNVPPTPAHIDSTYVDTKGIFMRWIAGSDALLAYHHVLRRLESQKEWTLLRRCDADSVKAANNYIDILDVPKANRSEEYVYAIESFNYSGISSGLSLQFCTRFLGETIIKTPIKLYASYHENNHTTRLAWEVDKLPEDNDWYFCIWRKGADEDRFKFLLSAKPTDRDFSDHLLRPGETAQYYIMIQMKDGRESEPSNVVTIKAPDKK